MPLKYLGVPLSSHKLKNSNFKCLLEKLNAKFTSWTSKHLSFSSRLQLIQSVIYSAISFCASIFILPNQSIQAIEQMCCDFLWKDTPNSARGATISWYLWCTLWIIFAASCSLWVSWIRRNFIGDANFWTLDVTSDGSWIWKCICKMWIIVRQFVACEVGSRITTNFWLNNWTSQWALLDVTCPRGPAI